jgi:hypothetical protein
MGMLDDFLPRRFAEEWALNRLRKALKHARAIHDQVKSLRQYVRKYRIELAHSDHLIDCLTRFAKELKKLSRIASEMTRWSEQYIGISEYDRAHGRRFAKHSEAKLMMRRREQTMKHTFEQKAKRRGAKRKV